MNNLDDIRNGYRSQLNDALSNYLTETDMIFNYDFESITDKVTDTFYRATITFTIRGKGSYLMNVDIPRLKPFKWTITTFDDITNERIKIIKGRGRFKIPIDVLEKD